MKHPPIHYSDYLGLEKLLSAQNPRSAQYGKLVHDEMLFITVHQAYELWFKQILFELDSVIKVFSEPSVDDREIALAVSHLQRIVEIQKLIIGQIDILETMTPMDFLEFRDFLFPASGFQSHQWRLLETKLGLKLQHRQHFNDEAFFKVLKPEHQQQIQQAMQSPSLFDLVEAWLERTPFLKMAGFDFWQTYKNAVLEYLQVEQSFVEKNSRLSPTEKEKTLQQLQMGRDTFQKFFEKKEYEAMQAQGQFRISAAALHAALFIQIYRSEPALQLPFQLISRLLDIDEKMTEWRYRHALMVQRMLGKKIGTGGSSGYDYLKSATEKHKVFSDLFSLSTFLIPRSRIPELPEEVRKKMHYQYGS
jgi:tryptophan 2,3-dioxygenase